ncbi:serine hydrolase [Streptomyces sp. P38-E01]|uniref:Serine hydrolase n=1 Tax=Streptomyces tardus TaxID=2780544 RepID=A0A949JLC5_9ACTN|nr:serine hydrolase [Streptomyces tardus]MBU7600855.1 serine hydrolase [Streptomyces tardus]
MPGHIARIAEEAETFLSAGPGRPAPSFPGCVLLAAKDGVIVAHRALGHAVRYERWDEEREEAVELPPGSRVPMAEDTIFDLASVTKLFTSLLAVQLAEQRLISLDDPAARHLPEFAATDSAKSAITVRQLLTHQSGMVSWIDLYALPDNEARYAAIYASELETPPGTAHTYSDLNMISLGRLMERVTGRTLDTLVAERLTGPLGMRDTCFNPPEALHARVAATEWQPGTDRGMVRGTVHDENAWALGGVAGHAGLFSTARDLAAFGQLMANGGRYGRTRILSEESVREVLTDHSAPLGASPRGLGWQVDQRFYMDALTTAVTTGHTGYTGTCLVVDPVAGTVFVLLTNRVHPTRERGTESGYRRLPARAFARAVPVRPVSGRTSWRAEPTAEAAATLTAPLPALRGPARAYFRLWYDTEPEVDRGTFERSEDGGRSWTPVAFTLRGGAHRWRSEGGFAGWSGRRWLVAAAELPATTTHLRWTYTTDGDNQGRGVYVDGMRVSVAGRPVFDEARPADASLLEADRWRRSTD